VAERLNRKLYKGLICDQNNLKDQSVTNLKRKGLRYDQNNLNDQFIKNLKFKGPLM